MKFYYLLKKITIQTLIEDTLENVSLFTPITTTCISINETGIEKWVGLTRRIMAIERGYEEDDKTLIRHVYDLNAITKNCDINSTLANAVIKTDLEQFKNQHPEYATDTKNEIAQSLKLLKNKPLWKKTIRRIYRKHGL